MKFTREDAYSEGSLTMFGVECTSLGNRQVVCEEKLGKTLFMGVRFVIVVFVKFDRVISLIVKLHVIHQPYTTYKYENLIRKL